MKEHILFICEFNLVRSTVAERMYSGKEGLEVSSAGIHEDARVQIDDKILQWADRIFVMEAHHYDYLIATFNGVCTQKQIVCLNVSEDYKGECLDLRQVLTNQLVPHLGNPVPEYGAVKAAPAKYADAVDLLTQSIGSGKNGYYPTVLEES